MHKKILMPGLANIEPVYASSKPKAKWVTRGVIAACECFSCSNKVGYKLKGSRVSILCENPCTYKLLEGEVRPAIDKIADIEQFV